MSLLRSPIGRALVTAILAFVVMAVVRQVRDEPASEVTVDGITVTTPWSRPTPPGVDVTAVYLTLRADVDDALVGVAVERAVAAAAGVHRNVVDTAGRSSMEPVERLDLPAGETVSLSPAGELHLMVEGLVTPLAIGDRFALELTFADAGAFTIDVAVTTDRH